MNTACLTPAWNGTVVHTDAYDEWRDSDQDIRAFLVLTQSWSSEGYEQAWRDVANAPGWDGCPGLDTAFHRSIGGLWPNDYEWMLLAAVVRDAVSAYEVYLEKVLIEALSRNRLAPVRDYGSRSMSWPVPRDWFVSLFDIVIESAAVQDVRELRHILTHRRGELRTEDQRRRFQDSEAHFSPTVALTQSRVVSMCDDLGDNVRRIDERVWNVACRDKPLGNFERIAQSCRGRIPASERM